MFPTDHFTARLIRPRIQVVADGAICQIIARAGLARVVVDNTYRLIECGQEFLVIHYLLVEMRADLVNWPGRQLHAEIGRIADWSKFRINCTDFLFY